MARRADKYRILLMGLLALTVVGALALSYVRLREHIPDSCVQTPGSDMPDPLSSFEKLFVSADIEAEPTEASANAYSTESYIISYKFLGIIPLRETSVEIRDAEYVIPGGVPVGIYMETDGVLIIGTGEVTGTDGLNYEPAYSIVKSGDYIKEVNGEAVGDKEDLIEAVNASKGDDVTLVLERDGELISVRLKTVQTDEDEYKLGIWVRDNIQGIGTLTFVTEDGKVGALGHGITDSDTGVLLDMSEGLLYETTITEITRGEAGSPGVLSGLIRYRDSLICGTLFANTSVGIFGYASERLSDELIPELMETGRKQDIDTGIAWVRSSVDGTLKDYRIEITEVCLGGNDVNKGIVFTVTDEELLELTGGIVQGMSGSPIIQNGKVIGAVTHVFVQDPAKGFGIFIETMMDELG